MRVLIKQLPWHRFRVAQAVSIYALIDGNYLSEQSDNRINSGKSLRDGFYQLLLGRPLLILYIRHPKHKTHRNKYKCPCQKTTNNQILTSDVHLLLSENEDRW